MSPPARLLPTALAALAALGGWSCEREAPPAQTTPPQAGRAPTVEPVVARAIERLEAELAALEPAPPPAPPADLEERLQGLLETLTSSRGALRSVALEELADLGDVVTPSLTAWLTDRERDAARRAAAAEALAAVDTPAAAEALLALLESSRTALEPEPWLYAQCAWQLGRTAQEWVLPRLVLCLKYEKDAQTAVWIADSAARLGVLAGLDALFAVQREGPEEVRREAEGVLERLRSELGCSDWADLERAWTSGDAAHLPAAPTSAAYRLEVWRCIAALGEWQLRGVDDARFVLARLREDDAVRLGLALADESVYVRLHAAQCLERMGPRARAAGDALIARLDDPQVGPQAAAALGGLRYGPALEPLCARLAPDRPLELRVAAARALAPVGSDAPAAVAAALRPLLAESEPVDLRAAAAQSELRTTAPDTPLADLAEPLRLLTGWMVGREVEPSEPELALAAWLTRRAKAGDASAGDALEAWNAVPLEPEQQRLAARAELLRSRFLTLER